MFIKFLYHYLPTSISLIYCKIYCLYPPTFCLVCGTDSSKFFWKALVITITFFIFYRENSCIFTIKSMSKFWLIFFCCYFGLLVILDTLSRHILSVTDLLVKCLQCKSVSCWKQVLFKSFLQIYFEFFISSSFCSLLIAFRKYSTNTIRESWFTELSGLS